MTSSGGWARWELILGVYVYVFVVALAAMRETVPGLAVVTVASQPVRRVGPHDRSATPSALQPEMARTVGMVAIPAGSYAPFFKGTSASPSMAVGAFLLDEVPVDRDHYLAFVTRNPVWRRSRVSSLFAEETYLADWPSDGDAGPVASDRPVTFVSWFAARAYCAQQGKRLPGLVEWESAARTPVGRRVLGLGVGASAANPLIVATASEWISDFNSALVSGGSAGQQPSKLFCGAGSRATDATDYETFLRYSFRSSLKANFALRHLGFRCAKDAS